MGGELIHAARRKTRYDESNTRVSRPRQRRVRTIGARNVLSRITLLFLPLNLNPEIGNSEWRSAWFSSVRHDTGNILNRPRYRVIRFAGTHISLSLWHCTTYNANSCHNRCGADLVRVICPPYPVCPAAKRTAWLPALQFEFWNVRGHLIQFSFCVT